MNFCEEGHISHYPAHLILPSSFTHVQVQHMYFTAALLLGSDVLYSSFQNFRYPDNTPTTKEGYWYRTIFEGHFPQRAAADTVPGGPSVACSTPTAALWDASWAGKEDPSGVYREVVVLESQPWISVCLGCSTRKGAVFGFGCWLGRGLYALGS